jgi:crotonobetainyl-CoA:carnitine CoA-transferase CaiB-like acyl-CoA transferase
MRRGKAVILLDLKQASAVVEAMALVAVADALIEATAPESWNDWASARPTVPRTTPNWSMAA